MIYYFHNEYHLGDNIFNILFFLCIREFLQKNMIYIYYYLQPQYISQAQEFLIDFPNVTLFDIALKPSQSFQIWIENPEIGETFTQTKLRIHGARVHYDIFYRDLFNSVMKIKNIPFKFSQFFFYTDDSLRTLYDTLDSKYHNLDILILNSQPLSGQYNYVKEEWDFHINYLNKHFKVVTTSPVNNCNALCTWHDNLTIRSIAALSTKAPIIIAVNSGVVPGLLNELTLKQVRRFFVFDNRCQYSFPNFVNYENITDITVDTLTKYIKVRKGDKQRQEEKEKEKREKMQQVEKQVALGTNPFSQNEQVVQDIQDLQESIKKRFVEFDWKAYVYINADLNHCKSEEEAWQHFLKHGIKENRIISFDWIKYIIDNGLEDKIQNKQEAFEHLVSNDNRKLYLQQMQIKATERNMRLKIFDWEFYRNKYPDLSGIQSYTEALNHYLSYGEREKREISDFCWTQYLLLNKDLIENGVTTETEAINHWIQYGKNEGRKYN